MASTNAKAAAAVQATLDQTTSDPNSGVPGLVFVSMDRKGNIIQASTSGKRGLGQPGSAPMTLDTVFWIASCTKLLTTIACMQQVEKGNLHLDDAQHLYRLCPELEKVQIIQDDRKTTKPKTKDITLRLLLTHTSGFAYEFFNEKLRDYGRPTGYNMFDGDVEDVLRMPLIAEPGSKWEYGIGIDWAGIALERATGTKLNDYLQQNIMQPLGLDSINMFPTEHMRENLASMHQRWPDGKIEERDHIMRRSLAATTPELQARVFNSGGAGAFAKPIQYIRILSTLLNDGTDPHTSHQILTPATVSEMFTNQIPHFPQFGRQGIPAAKRDQTNPLPDLYPQPGDPAQGWGLSFMQTLEPSAATGRGAATGWWAGIANLFWWVDREKGVAGMVASQIMPFADGPVMGAWFAGEKGIYDSL